MADQYTFDLLTTWGCAHLIEAFRDAKIDAVALGLLNETDISSLIPFIGDRVKFRANWSMWKTDNESVKVIGDSSLVVIDASINEIISDLQGPTQVVNLQVQEGSQSHPDRDKIKSILERSHRGRALLKSEGGTKGLLDSIQRKELAHLILDSVLDEDPNIQLTWAHFQSWARGIAELFPLESPVVYYASYIAAGAFQAKRNASGILYNTYLRKRKSLIKKKVAVPFRKRRAPSESSDFSSDVESPKPYPCPIDLSIIDETESELVEEALLAITIAIEGATPWNEINKFWAITTKTRLQKLYNKNGTILDYLDEYPVLRGPHGYQLLVADYDRIYPATGILRISLQNVADNIIEKAKTLLSLTKDQFVKLALTELISSIDDNLDIKLSVSLLLLPLLINTTPLKGKGVKKTSKAVIRDNFILRVPASANLEVRLAEHKDTLKAWKMSFQPIVVYIGETVTSFEKCYVIIEDTRYELPDLVTAVDTAFKIFQATAAEYPILAYDIWFFIQRGFYNVETRYDRRISQSVKTFLVDLGLKERC